MIKITFEVSEDFIRENANPEACAAKIEKDKNPVKTFIDACGFCMLEKEIEKGKKEFVVTPDELDEKTMNLYNIELGEICILAAFSEMDKKKANF